MITSYSLHGDFLESCDCFDLCPCWVDDDPDDDHCTGLVAWRLEEGSTITTDKGPVDVTGAVAAAVTGHGGARRRSSALTVRSSAATECCGTTHPPTPVWRSPAGEQVWLRLVGACDKPRNHTFTVHGVDWAVAPWLARTSRTSGLSGLSADTAHDIVVVPRHRGDHAFRSGAFRWSVEQGMWGILRVRHGRRIEPGHILSGLLRRATGWILAKACWTRGAGR